MSRSFGAKELISALECLGFKKERQTGSRHLKYSSPNIVEKGKRPFIIVIQNRSTYDPVTCKKYIRQIEALGFERSEIKLCDLC